MALKLKAKAQTSVEKKHKGQTTMEDHNEEVVGEAIKVPEPHAEIGFEASSTINQGNFNSVRIAVSVRLPCAPDEIDDTFAYAKDWVDERLSKLIEEVTEE